MKKISTNFYKSTPFKIFEKSTPLTSVGVLKGPKNPLCLKKLKENYLKTQPYRFEGPLKTIGKTYSVALIGFGTSKLITLVALVRAL